MTPYSVLVEIKVVRNDILNNLYIHDILPIVHCSEVHYSFLSWSALFWSSYWSEVDQTHKFDDFLSTIAGKSSDVGSRLNAVPVILRTHL